jgi:Rhs element Vgr protein
MSDTRTLPIAAEHREFIVKADGQEVSRKHQLVSVDISVTVNRIGRARLVYVDGAAASSSFPLSDSALFKPGQRIEILAGSSDEQESLFDGIVVRHGVRVSERAGSRLIVECRHAAMKLAVTRRSVNYFDCSDSDIIDELLSAAGVDADIESTTVTHKQVVQYLSTDWDFLLARAQANGKLVWCEGDTLIVRAPSVDAEPVCTLLYGATLLEFAAEIDARLQVDSLHGLSWDSAQQELIDVEGAAPELDAPGNLSSSELADVAGCRLDLCHVALCEAEAQAWADGTGVYRRLNQISGYAKCVGIGSVRPGTVVELSGVGERFNGKVFVSAVRHEYGAVQGWKTHIQFGGVPLEPAASAPAPAVGGLLAPASGLHIGIVTSNEDPDGEHRVRIRLPLLGDDDGLWARVASVDAGDDRGFFIRPEIGDEVVIGFLDTDPRHPVILGMLHSSAKAAPLQGSDDNHQKLYKSRSGMRLHFDDEKKIMTLDTPSGNALILNEDEESLTLMDQNGNKIALSADGIVLESAKALTIKASTELSLESGTALTVEGGTELALKGAAQAELSCDAITKITGSVVQIN